MKQRPVTNKLKYGLRKPVPGKAKHGEIRIIAGQWRGRRLPVVSAEGLRPTSDRARETLFNWLQIDVLNSRCLDLFAGSGALGFEAASRGAASVQLIEKQGLVVKQLQANIDKLEASTVKVLQGDSLEYCQKVNRNQSYDLIFVDPPWQLQCHQKVLDNLIKGKWVAPGGIIFCETPNNSNYFSHTQLTEIKSKIIGEAQLSLFSYVDISESM